jgi:hypothetical protein
MPLTFGGPSAPAFSESGFCMPALGVPVFGTVGLCVPAPGMTVDGARAPSLAVSLVSYLSPQAATMTPVSKGRDNAARNLLFLIMLRPGLS